MIGEKKVIKLALSFKAAGTVLFVVGCLFGGNKPIWISSHGVNIESDKYIVDERKEVDSFNNMNINVDYADIEIEKGEKLEIESIYDKSFEEISYDVSEGTLNINGKSKRKNFFNISFFGNNENKNSTIKIFIPDNSTISNIKLKLDNGDMKVNDLNLINADLCSNYGEVSLNTVNFSTIRVNSKYGDIICNNIKGDVITIDSQYGGVEADNMEAESFIGTLKCGNMNFNNIKIRNSTLTNEYGDIKADEVAANGINIVCKSGDIDISGELTGKNIINSEYGDVKINTSILEKDYSYDLSIKAGECKINDRNQDNYYKKTESSTDNMINAVCKCGDLKINFKE